MIWGSPSPNEAASQNSVAHEPHFPHFQGDIFLSTSFRDENQPFTEGTYSSWHRQVSNKRQLLPWSLSLKGLFIPGLLWLSRRMCSLVILLSCLSFTVVQVTVLTPVSITSAYLVRIWLGGQQQSGLCLRLAVTHPSFSCQVPSTRSSACIKEPRIQATGTGVQLLDQSWVFYSA